MKTMKVVRCGEQEHADAEKEGHAEDIPTMVDAAPVEARYAARDRRVEGMAKVVAKACIGDALLPQ